MSTGKRSAVDYGPKLKLTPAASEALDESVELVRQQILRELARRYDRSEHQARASDVESVVRALTNATEPGLSRHFPKRTLFSVALTSVCVVGQLIILFNNSVNTWLLLIATIMIGAVGGIAAAEVTFEVRRRVRISNRSQQEFLRVFNTLEYKVRSRASEVLDRAADSLSLGRVISAIELMQLWTPADSRAFRKLLSLRNMIVHEDSRKITAQEIASGFSEIARLSALLSSGGSKLNPLKEVSRNKAALSFEERVINALRKSRINVSVAPADVEYDLVIGQGDTVVRGVVLYRRSGILTVKDVADVVGNTRPGVATAIITNVPVSGYVHDYLELNEADSRVKEYVTIFSWLDEDDSDSLVQAILPSRVSSD